MSEKRFELVEAIYNEVGKQQIEIMDNLEKQILDKQKIADLLNEQEDTIITLKRRLEKINGGYGHLTHRNGLTANEWVIESQERELKKKNEQISEWIEQHSKDIAKISEQNKLIQNLKEENDNCKNDYRELFSNYVALEEENEQLQQFINKGKRLSVKELIDNVNENLVLKKKIRGLEKDNERLKEELNNFKPVMFQDMRKGTVILYSKGDIDE